MVECLPGACPVRYLHIKYLISSPRLILTLGSSPSRPQTFCARHKPFSQLILSIFDPQSSSLCRILGYKSYYIVSQGVFESSKSIPMQMVPPLKSHTPKRAEKKAFFGNFLVYGPRLLAQLSDCTSQRYHPPKQIFDVPFCACFPRLLLATTAPCCCYKEWLHLRP